MKYIKVLELGGTISAKGADRFDFKDYQSGMFDGKDFLHAVPELASIASITFETFSAISSTAIDASHWLALRKRINDIFATEGYDGIVLTHGTNTIEETAYFLHLTIPYEKPVVLTGSQKPFTAIGTDAFLNLYHAIKVAADEESVGKGVLVVLNETIHGAREVTKTNTYRQEAFQSGQFGCLGFVDPDGKVVFYRASTRKHTVTSEFAQATLCKLPNVDIIYSYAGADGHLISGVTTSGQVAGIVTAGTGAGLVSPKEYAALQDAINAGIMVVRSSRVGNGRVLGTEKYEKDGFLSADNLLPQKARILLILGLATYTEPEQIQQLFHVY